MPAALAAMLGAEMQEASADAEAAEFITGSADAGAAAATGRTLRQAAADSNLNLNEDLPLNAAVDSNFVVPLKVMVGISSSFLAQVGDDASITAVECLASMNHTSLLLFYQHRCAIMHLVSHLCALPVLFCEMTEGVGVQGVSQTSFLNICWQ
jgi:hypothetical protein